MASTLPPYGESARRGFLFNRNFYQNFLLNKNTTINRRIYLIMIRKIIEINEELCNGCGLCAHPPVTRGAIGIVDGKAKAFKR